MCFKNIVAFRTRIDKWNSNKGKKNAHIHYFYTGAELQSLDIIFSLLIRKEKNKKKEEEEKKSWYVESTRNGWFCVCFFFLFLIHPLCGLKLRQKHQYVYNTLYVYYYRQWTVAVVVAVETITQIESERSRETVEQKRPCCKYNEQINSFI